MTTYLKDLYSNELEVIAINECGALYTFSNQTFESVYRFDNRGTSHDIIFNYAVHFNRSTKQVYTALENGNSDYDLYIQFGFACYSINNSYDYNLTYSNLTKLEFNNLGDSQNINVLNGPNNAMQEAQSNINGTGYSLYPANNFPLMIRTIAISSDYADFIQQWFDLTYNEGYEDGYNEGHDLGYMEGISTSTTPLNNGLGVMTELFNGVGGVLNTQVMPNITIGGLVSIPLIGILIIAIFKLLK